MRDPEQYGRVAAIPQESRADRFRAYPYGWFGILAEAPRSSDELIYTHCDRGFAIISTRTAPVQRTYFQCDPQEEADDWTDGQIWDELQSRVAGDGFELAEGRIFERSVIPLRSYVCEPMRYGQLFLASGRTDLLDGYSDTALRRVWEAQHFSWWMTSMLHTPDGAADFDVRRQLGELDMVTSSAAGCTYLAEAYVGWPGAASQHR